MRTGYAPSAWNVWQEEVGGWAIASDSIQVVCGCVVGLCILAAPGRQLGGECLLPLNSPVDTYVTHLAVGTPRAHSTAQIVK